MKGKNFVNRVGESASELSLLVYGSLRFRGLGGEGVKCDACASIYGAATLLPTNQHQAGI